VDKGKPGEGEKRLGELVRTGKGVVLGSCSVVPYCLSMSLGPWTVRREGD
jgi:hypothetical protein